AADRPAPPAPREVDWPALRTELRARQQTARDFVLERAPAEELRLARLPVLIPDFPTMRMAGRVFARRDFYSASFTLPDAMVEVFGTRLVAPTPKDMIARFTRMAAADPDGFRIVETEAGFDLSFERYNVAYNISLNCNDPKAEDCRSPERIRDLARRMRFAGGEPEGGL
ncbi:MAG: hypothetical protein HXY25_05880, partial [Alphaproteobacteria bacterium]|nr:hypothetical protein [Alphaproteobacteria bacterium]